MNCNRECHKKNVGSGMREIIFRGILAHSEKWVQGNLIISNKGNPYIYPQDFIEQDGHHLLLDTDEAFWVIPETTGQFTGLTDKNGVKIFEGDIYTHGDMNILYVVVWRDAGFIGKQIGSSSYAGLKHWLDCTEVIGNIHDNPELLEKQEVV